MNNRADGQSNRDIPVGMEGNGTCGAGITLKSAGFSLALVLCLGMLIWVKLRLVTNFPRMAYAEPEKKQFHPPAPHSSTTADATQK